MSAPDRFEMLYCDISWCRVNTFERGESSLCPGCQCTGLPLTANHD